LTITLNGFTTAARYILPATVFADFAAFSSFAAPPWAPIARFGLAYVTVLATLAAFHRRPASQLALGVAITLAVAWAVNTIGSDVDKLLNALAGALCALFPALLRDLQSFVADEDYMDLDDIRTLRRRRADSRGDGKRAIRRGQWPIPISDVRHDPDRKL
jgi:hypothetical protein